MLLRQGIEALEPGAKRNTRHRLIVAAAILLQRRGFYGVGTNEILELAEVPRGSLYHHFPNGKSELTAAAIEWVGSEAIFHIRQLRLAGRDAGTIIDATAHGIAAWMEATNFSEGSLLAAMASCLGSDEERVRLSVNRAYEKLIEEFATAMRGDGVVKEEARSLAERVVSELEGATLVARARQSDQPLVAASDRLLSQLSRSMPSTG